MGIHAQLYAQRTSIRAYRDEASARLETTEAYIAITEQLIRNEANAIQRWENRKAEAEESIQRHKEQLNEYCVQLNALQTPLLKIII